MILGILEETDENILGLANLKVIICEGLFNNVAIYVEVYIQKNLDNNEATHILWC